jgi:hypothetical protein
MKIAIVEVMPRGHYTLVESLLRIFGSDKENMITLVLRREGASILSSYISEFGPHVDLKIVTEDNEIGPALLKLQQEPYDRIYLITVERYFGELYQTPFRNKIYLFIHNIDEWFGTSFVVQMYRIFRSISFSKKFLYTIKANTIYPRQRKALVRKVLNSHGRFVVLAESLRKELSKYVDNKIIDILPFSVFNNKLAASAQSSSYIRICIPGMISQHRRDYQSVIKMIYTDIELFKHHFEIDFLGGIAFEDGGQQILDQIINLEQLGVKVHYYNRALVPVPEFDQHLIKADIILGNVHVVVDKFSAYGKTKETGLPFTMLRAAKPGLLISGYAFPEDITSSALVYRDYSDLLSIFRKMSIDRSQLEKLRFNALTNSLKYSPEHIYRQIKTNES